MYFVMLRFVNQLFEFYLACKRCRRCCSLLVLFLPESALAYVYLCSISASKAEQITTYPNADCDILYCIQDTLYEFRYCTILVNIF